MSIPRRKCLADTLRKIQFALPLLLAGGTIPACSAETSSSDDDLSALAAVVSPAGGVAPDCSALSSPIFQVVNPQLKTNLLTASQNEAQKAASSYGFTEDHGTPFYASVTSAGGLLGAHRMYNSTTHDFFWTINSAEIALAVQKYGYADQGINFYVSASAGSCTQPVYRFLSGNVHRFAVSQADRDALTASGWKLEGVMFYAAVKGAGGTDTGCSDPSAVPGAAPIGTTRYTLENPSNALYVDPINGNDANRGTEAAPFLTLKNAVRKAAAGQTIVLRGGTYHEIGIVITTPNLTIQSYPGEAVWLDGSTVVSGWAQEGNAWVHSGWTAKFGSDPTFSWGAPDSTAPSWQFVNPEFPMAAHPDQVWINGARQAQVATLGEVVPGKFFVDYATSKLYIGSNPAGVEVRASDLGSPTDGHTGAPKGAAMTVTSAPNVTIRGIGVRRYATAVPDLGTIYVNNQSAGLRFENVEIADNAAVGMSMSDVPDATLQNVSAHDNGLAGIMTTYCDRLLVDSVSATQNNTESFNSAPAAAGMKVVRSRDAIVSNSRMADNRAIGLWFDEDCYNMTVVSNEFSNNSMIRHQEDAAPGTSYLGSNQAHGLMIEISGTGNVANNRFLYNGTVDLYVLMSDSINIWNNTMVGGKVGLKVQNGQGRTRTWTLPSGYPVLSWVVDNVTVSNNILGGSSANLVTLKDDTGQRTGTVGVTLNGNVYWRADAASPKDMISSLKGSTYPTLAAFIAATGQDSQSVERTGAASVDANGYATADLQNQANTIAKPIPTAIATVMQVSANAKILGPVPAGCSGQN